MSVLAWGTAPGRAVLFCAADSGCGAAARHPAATWAGLPVAVWALALYLLLWPCGPDRWFDAGRRLVAGAGVGLLTVASAVYLFIMERDLLEPCPWCLAAHAAHGGLAVIMLHQWHRRPVIAAAPPPARIAIPGLLLLLAAFIWQGYDTPPIDASSLRPSLRRAIAPDFDRFFPAAAEEYIAGNAGRPYQLTIIGSLACRHCRALLSGIEQLPENLLDRLGIAFIPFPLCSHCNPKAAPQTAARIERCVLASQTREAQRQGRFWQWLHTVDRAPGRVLRRLRTAPVDTDRLRADLHRLRPIPIATIPTLLWQGRILPSEASSLDVPTLVRMLLDIEADIRAAIPPVDSCGSC